MDELKDIFLLLDEEEFTDLISQTEAKPDIEISSKIKKRLDIPEEKKNAKIRFLRPSYIIPMAAALFLVIAAAVTFSLDLSKPSVTTTPSTTAVTSAVAEETPLMVAIRTGNEELISSLLSLPGMISRDTLGFALDFSDLLSYETISKIAISVQEKLGSTGLDALLESVILGNSQKALAELNKKESILMTPAEKLAFFFAVAFCDSEVVDAFVNLGCDINATDSQGNSIYAIAEKYGNEEIMQYAASKGITA